MDMNGFNSLKEKQPPAWLNCLYAKTIGDLTLGAIDNERLSNFVFKWNGNDCYPLDEVWWREATEQEVSTYGFREVFFLRTPELKPCPFCNNKPTMTPSTRNERGSIRLGVYLEYYKSVIIEPCCKIVRSGIYFDQGRDFVARWNNRNGGHNE